MFFISGLHETHTLILKSRLPSTAYTAHVVSSLIAVLFFYFIPYFGITPKTNLLLNVLIFGVLFLIWRKLFGLLFSSRFFNNVAILGKDLPKIRALAKEIAARPYLGYRLTAIFNNSKNLLAKIKEKKINALIVAEDFETDFDLLENLYQCLEARIIFWDWSQAYELFCEKIPTDFLQKKWFLENLKEGERKLYDKIKKGQDLILATILLIATSPLWPLIAILIKLGDGGPIIYRQERIGKDRKPFFLLKFRSMNIEAESKTGPVWAKEEDPRVTKVGKWLRRIHLDELPQMINVLR